MSNFIGEKHAYRAKQDGVFLGRTNPDSETKWTHWEVYYYEHEIIACVMDGGYVSCGEKLDNYTSLKYYVDDELDAIERFAKCLL